MIHEKILKQFSWISCTTWILPAVPLNTHSVTRAGGARRSWHGDTIWSKPLLVFVKVKTREEVMHSVAQQVPTDKQWEYVNVRITPVALLCNRPCLSITHLIAVHTADDWSLPSWGNTNNSLLCLAIRVSPENSNSSCSFSQKYCLVLWEWVAQTPVLHWKTPLFSTFMENIMSLMTLI